MAYNALIYQTSCLAQLPIEKLQCVPEDGKPWGGPLLKTEPPHHSSFSAIGRTLAELWLRKTDAATAAAQYQHHDGDCYCSATALLLPQYCSGYYSYNYS